MADLVGIYLLAAASAASVPAGEPVQLSAEAAGDLLLTDIRKAPHRITFTPELSRLSSPPFWGEYQVCVDREGKVTTVKVIRAASRRDGGRDLPGAPSRGLDRRWMEKVKTWRYQPYQENGQPRPFCYVANLELPQQHWSADLHSPEDEAVVRLSDINAFPHRPTLPPELNRASFALWGLYKVCIGAEGQVTKISIIKSADDATLDQRWTMAMFTWRYQPHLENGQPKPYCFSERLEVRLVAD
jgi:hypothetical protein